MSMKHRQILFFFTIKYVLYLQDLHKYKLVEKQLVTNNIFYKLLYVSY